MDEAIFFDTLREGAMARSGNFTADSNGRADHRLDGWLVSGVDLYSGNDPDVCAKIGRDLGGVLGVDELYD